MRVLPREAYLELAATGSFAVKGDNGTYRLSRIKKTELTKSDGSVYSACIDFSEADCPRQDRIVMEYLLIKADEERYNKTANWSQMIFAPNAPPRFSVRINSVTAALIVSEALRLVMSHEPLRRRSWSLVSPEYMSQPMFSYIREEFACPREALSMSLDDFSSSYLRVPASRLASTLANTGINSIVDLPLPYGMYVAAKSQDRGLSLRYLRAYDLMTDTFPSRFDIGIIRE